MVWVRTGLAREESVKHTFEYNATLSFLFSRLEKAFTRVVSSLILSGVTIEAHFMLKKINNDIVIFNSDHFRGYSIKKCENSTIGGIKANLAKNCFECEKLLNDVAEKRRNRLACLSSPICVITPFI